MIERPAVVVFGSVILSAALLAQSPPAAPAGRSARSAPWREPLDVRETVLARLDADANRDTLLADDAGRHVAWISGRKPAQRVVVDGTPGPVFHEVPFGRVGNSYSPLLSPDGSRTAYHAKRDRKWFVVVDGKEYGSYDGGNWRPPIVFSANSRRVAWGAERSGKYIHVVDGVEHGPYEMPDQSLYLPLLSPVFSPDSRRVAFRAPTGQGKQKVVRVVVDGAAGPPHRWAGAPRFSPDSLHVAYWAREHDEGGLHLIVDGKRAATSQSDSAESLSNLDSMMASFDLPFAPDASRLAYILEQRNGLVAVIHGKEGPPTPSILPIAFSPDFKRSAYTAVSTKALYRMFGAFSDMARSGAPPGVWANSRLVVDGVEQPTFPRPWGNPRFSPDGRLAYTSKKSVVLDGVSGPVYEEVWPDSIVFSSDSRRMAYVAKNKVGWLVVVDGVEGPAYEDLAASTVAFSPSGRIAYAAKKQGAWQMVSDGAEGRPYTKLGPLVPQGGREALAFTPGDEHVVYKALDGRSKVIIGNVGATPEYDHVFRFVVFDGPAVLTFVAGRADQLLRVEVDIPTGRVTLSNRSASFKTG